MLYPLSYGGVVDVSTSGGYRPGLGEGQQGVVKPPVVIEWSRMVR